MSHSHRMLLISAIVLLAAGLVAALADQSEGASSVSERAEVPVTVAPPPEPDPPMPAPAPAVEAEPEVTAPPTTAIGLPAIAPNPEVRAVRTPGGLVLPVVGGGAGAWEVMTPCAETAVVGGEPVLGAHVVLDPGHGGNEPGAVGPSGLREADVNLDIALRVRDLLEAEGTDVVLTRDRDIRLTLATRAAIARATSPLAFVSIHHNAAPVGRSPVPGSELYHQLESPESRRLAGLLWEELQAHLSPYGDEWAAGDQPGARARKSLNTGQDYYGILRHAGEVTAVLTEAVFLSDAREEALLLTEEFRDAEARAITRGILRLARTQDPGSGFVPTKEVSTPAGGGGGTRGCVDPPLG